MKAKVNSGFGRNPGARTGAPTKPGGTVKSGFLPLEMGNTNTKRAPGMRQNLPHTSDSRRTPPAYAGKDRPAAPKAGKRRMY